MILLRGKLYVIIWRSNAVPAGTGIRDMSIVMFIKGRKGKMGGATIGNINMYGYISDILFVMYGRRVV